MERRIWTREELILALNLYLKIPFGKIHHQNPDIIHLAGLIDRTSSSVSMRLSNFASVDPFHQRRGIKGLQGGIKQVQPSKNTCQPECIPKNCTCKLHREMRDIRH
jgi:putative restriction endonuclease